MFFCLWSHLPGTVFWEGLWQGGLPHVAAEESQVLSMLVELQSPSASRRLRGLERKWVSHLAQSAPSHRTGRGDGV